MRRLTSRWLTLLTTLLIALSIAPTVRADPILYTSSGEVGGSGSGGVGNFSLNPMNGALFGPGSIALATFQAPIVPTGATLTFTNMPFFINLDFQPNGQNGTPSEVTIHGELNGTLMGTTSSSVVATVSSIDSTNTSSLPFSLDSFNVLTPQTLAPSGFNGGNTGLIGQVTAMSTPEPTPLAILGILVAGTFLRSGIRRIQRRS